VSLLRRRSLPNQLPAKLIQFHFGLFLRRQQHRVKLVRRFEFHDHSGAECPPVFLGHLAVLGKWFHGSVSSVH